MTPSVKKIALLLLTLPLLCSTVSASPLHLTGNWSKPFGDNTDQWQLGQSYNLDLSNDITSALRFNGSVRYTTTKREGGSETKTLSPSLLLGLNNDLFNLSINGSTSQREVDDEPKNNTHSWSTTFVSSLDEKYYPKVRFTLSQNFTDDDANPKTTDQETTSFDSGIQYKLSLLTLLYDYSTSRSTNNITKTENENNNHSVRAQIKKSLWNKRLSVIASHKYTNNDNTTTTKSGGGEITVPIYPTSALYSLDDIAENDLVNAEPALIDGDLFTPTSIELLQPTETLHVGVQTGLTDFNELIFYLDREISTTTQSRLHFDFYGAQNNDFDTWHNNLPAANITYSIKDGRTQINIRFASMISTVRYIKAVITSDLGIDTALITELEVNKIATLAANENSITTARETHQSQGSINFRPWSKWDMGYSFNRTETLPEESTESVQFNHTLSSTLNWNRYFALSLSVSESTDEIETQDEIKNRSYALSYRATPLDSLTFSLGGTHTEHLEDNKRTSRSETYNTHIAATLLPDLTASLSGNWTKSHDELKNDSTTSWDYKVNIAARFTSKLNLSMSYTYRGGDSSDSEGEYDISSVYRPSTYISLTSGFQHSEDSDNFYSTLNFRLTNKIQTDLHYNYVTSDSTLQNANFNLTWNLSKMINIRQTLSWVDDQTDDSWSGLLAVNYNF